MKAFMPFMPFMLIIALTLFVAFLLVAKGKKKKELEDEQLTQEVREVMEQVCGFISKAHEVKTTQAKVNNYNKAIDAMNLIASNPEWRNMVANYDNTLDQLQRMLKVSSVLVAINKANKCRFERNSHLEKKALLDALYEIKLKQITNEDFKISGLIPEGVEEVMQTEHIVRRLRTLGWAENNRPDWDGEVWDAEVIDVDAQRLHEAHPGLQDK